MRKALTSAVRLVGNPLDFRQAVRFAEAVSDAWPIRAAYARMAQDLDPAHAARLRALQAIPIDVRTLATLPTGTFGRCFADFVRNAGIAVNGQVKVEPELAHAFAANWVMARFVRVHDFHHTLFEVPADPVAEAGLQAFNFANFREPFGLMGIVGTPLVMKAYGQPLRTLRVTRWGLHAGRTCPNLLWHPYEEWWEHDIDAVRARIGLPRELVGKAA